VSADDLGQSLFVTVSVSAVQAGSAP